MLLVPKDGKISWLTNLLNMIVSDVIPEELWKEARVLQRE
jgi:hypothetical protein